MKQKKWKSNPINRRDFLKKTGGIAGLAVLSQLPFSSMAFAEDQNFSFGIIADTHIDPYTPARSERLRTIFNELSDTSKPTVDFILHVGDVVEAGLPEEYQEYDKIVPAALKNRVHAVPGNHEVRWDEWAGELYNDMFGKSQYSFDHGGIHFIALDPTQLLQEPGFFTPSQLDWLEKDLQKVGLHMPVVVYLHYPIGNNNYYIMNENKFFQAVERYNVRAVFTGHIHREEVWKQNGMTLIALPAAKDCAVYHWVEKKIASNGSPALAVYHAEFTDSAESKKTLLVEIPLDGIKPAQFEKPKLVHFSESKDESGTGSLHVELSPKGSILSVQCQFWPEYRYAGKDAGEWQDLLPAGTGSANLRWQANVNTSDMASGIYLLQVRMTNTSGEFWDEFQEISISESGGAFSKSRVNWEQVLGSPIQADLLTVTTKNGTSSLVVASTMDGKIAVLDPENAGKIKWSYNTGGAILGTPAVNKKQDRILVGSADHNLYAIDTDTGNKIWTCKFQKPILGTPLWVESNTGGADTVLVPVGRMMAGVDAETGALLWSTQIEGFSAGKPASDGRFAFIGSGDGKVRAIDMATGKVIWTKTIANKESPYRTLLYSPWASNAELLRVAGRELVLIADVTNAYALDSTTGEVVWRLKGGFLYSSPLILSEPEPLMILADEWGKVFAVDPATGSVRWNTVIEQRIFNASPVLVNDTIYLTGVNGLLTGLNPKNGSVVDRYHFSTGYTYSTPVPLGNILVAAGQDGKVQAITLKNN